MARCFTRYLRSAGIPGVMLGAGLLFTQTGAALAGDMQAIAVELGHHRFSPDQIQVYAGQTVRLELNNTEDFIAHNFTLQAKDAGLDLDIDVPPGKTRSVEIRPTAPGSYTFFCNKALPFMKSHRELGMEGQLKVLPARR